MKEGFPSPKKIAEWKLLYGEIYSASSDGVTFIYRRLNIEEFCNLELYEPGEKQETYILNSCILTTIPVIDFELILPGTSTSLVNEILLKSSWSDPEMLKKHINNGRMNSNAAALQMVAMICKSFTSLNPVDIMKWSIEKICLYNGLAEQIVGGKVEIQTEEDLATAGSNQVGDQDMNQVVCRKCGYKDMLEPGTLCPRCQRSKMRKPFNWNADNASIISNGAAKFGKKLTEEEISQILEQERRKKQQKKNQLREELKKNIQS